MTIRPARPDEAARLTDIAMRAKAHWGYDDAFMTAVRDELTETARGISNRPTFALERGGRVVGFAALEPVTEADVELAALFVEPAHIGTGCGRALMDHVVAAAHAAGYRRMVIAADPYAERFYRAAGAVVVGRTPSDSIPGRTLPLLHLTL